LSDSKQSGVIKSLVEGIDLAASYSAKCLQDACCHLLPIMQLAVTKMHPLLSDHSGNQQEMLFFVSFASFRTLRFVCLPYTSSLCAHSVVCCLGDELDLSL